jgi:hypothetical protein
MSTKAGTIEVPGRPVGFRLWAAAVSVIAGAALIMSAVALTRAGRTFDREAASVGAPLWDAGKLEAMAGRVLAETVGAEGSATPWDAGKLEAMAGRVLAETGGAEGSATLWDAGKLEAMAGRVLAG